MPDTSTYFAQVAYSYGGGWGIGATPEEALAVARRSVGLSARDARKSPHYVLEFPAAAQITVNDLTGGWMADLAPLRVERQHGLPAGADLLGRPPERVPG